ncbi:uncharacterized protein LOC126672830 [Mercurialis annua]|uniref:uncharacterized protein LOC126672830 n=1 Tax=Mercurialis annua TaxID=3986 RepID=UPI00215F3ED0|nr:uncharacterized protein LOC126672830 [Mercurialis annua]
MWCIYALSVTGFYSEGITEMRKKGKGKSKERERTGPPETPGWGLMDESDSDDVVEVSPGLEFFQINLHINEELGEWGYHDGEVFTGIYSVSDMSMRKLDKWVKREKVNGLVDYYWNEKDKEFHDWMRPINHEDDVMEMARAGKRDGEVDVYVRKLTIKDIESLVPPPPSPPHVVIEEIPNPNDLAYVYPTPVKKVRSKPLATKTVGSKPLATKDVGEGPSESGGSWLIPYVSCHDPNY